MSHTVCTENPTVVHRIKPRQDFKIIMNRNLFMNAASRTRVHLSFTSQENLKRINKNAELKPVQECCSKNDVDNGSRFLDNEFLEVYPFIEDPVTFFFGDDYGNQLFIDLQNELSYETVKNKGPLHGDGEMVEQGMKYSWNDIYFLSSEGDMIECFTRENLF